MSAAKWGLHGKALQMNQAKIIIFSLAYFLRFKKKLVFDGILYIIKNQKYFIRLVIFQSLFFYK
jgi:hypothetical protein